MTGLAKVTEKIFGVPLCKKEQMSNWERRPLRLSQQHYGALDAYILVEIIKILAEQGKENNQLVEKNIYTLDNKSYRPSQTEDDDLDEDGGESATKFMGSRAQINYADQPKNKKKHFGAQKDKQFKDFIASENLTPEHKSQGFLVDKHLFKVGRLMQEKGIDVNVSEDLESEQLCALAIKENRIFVTSNLKMFNKKISIPRCCLNFKASPHCKLFLNIFLKIVANISNFRIIQVT